MIVEKIMKPDVFTLKPTDTIEAAIQMMSEKRIRHIPILDEGNNMVGIVSDRDIRDVLPSSLLSEWKKEDITQPLSVVMTKDVIYGHPLDFVEEIAAQFYEHKIGCLPIVKEGKLVGIVTESDLLHTFIQLTGAHQPASQFEIKVENIAGKLAEVTSILRKRKLNILSVLVYPDDNEKYKILVLRVQTMDPTKVISDLKEEGYEVLWPNLQGIDV